LRKKKKWNLILDLKRNGRKEQKVERNNRDQLERQEVLKHKKRK
jgi:hypothetical protein